jgi:hypothetical protein
MGFYYKVNRYIYRPLLTVLPSPLAVLQLLLEVSTLNYYDIICEAFPEGTQSFVAIFLQPPSTKTLLLSFFFLFLIATLSHS